MQNLESTKALFDRWERVWNNGELDLVPSCVAEKYIRHEDAGERIVSPQEYASEIERLRSDRPNMRIVAYDHAFDGERAWYRVDFKWTDKDSGEERSRASLQVWRIEHGKLAEAWVANHPVGTTWGDAAALERWTAEKRQAGTRQLFSTFQLGQLQLRNRVVMAPMTRSRAIGNIPNDLVAEYYTARADSGLIITEGASPSPDGLGQPRTPGLFNREQVRAWRKVTDRVHEKGGRIFVQLMHTGRVAHPANMPERSKIVAPSPVAIEGNIYTDTEGHKPYPVPSQMSTLEIEHAIEEFVQAARYAVEAGFDGVEINAANGYLIEQFLHPSANRRSDEWGGEGRDRFALEIARRTASAIGGDRVGIRISPHGAINDTGPFPGVDAFYLEFAAKLSELGLVYIHLVDHSSMGAPQVPADLKAHIRERFRGAFLLSGGYDASRAEADLADGKGDLVVFGRPYLNNPDLVEKLKVGAPLRDADPHTFYTPGPEGYTEL